MSSTRRVAIVCYPGIQPMDVVGPHDVFAGANEYLDATHNTAPRYELIVCAAIPGPVVSTGGLGIVAPHPLPSGSVHTMLLPGGDGVYTARQDLAFVEAVRGLAGRAERITTVCSGTFLAAAAGLLDGCRVTTHWSRASKLAAEHPELDVDRDAIYIHDGRVWTSAGVTAGIDLALALVEADHDATVAQTVARHLLVFLRRPGGQSQFAAPVWDAPVEREAVRAAQDLVNTDPTADLRVGALAAVSNMSERHFTRVFAAEVGEPPAKYVERVRVEAARRRLEQHGATVAGVARQCGFGTSETMRRAFLRRVGVGPDDYRRRFASDR